MIRIKSFKNSLKFSILMVSLLNLLVFIGACSSTQQGRSGGLASADFGCSGSCPHQNLSIEDVEKILKQAIAASNLLGVKATIAITDRVGNVLALYQMEEALNETRIDGQLDAVGGLEGVAVPATWAAISKAGTGAFLSSQGNAFSTRTASQIIQENFNPGEFNQPGGPLFGVQFSQLLCSDITTRQDDFKDARASGTKPSYSGLVGPRALPLGLSADPGGIPLYKRGDVVGGMGIEIDGVYRLDRNPLNFDDDVEERVAMMASTSFEAPSKRVAPNINVGKSLRYVDLDYSELEDVSVDEVEIEPARLINLSEFFGGVIRAGAVLGSPSSGVKNLDDFGFQLGSLVDDLGNERFPPRAGSSLGGDELSIEEVEALLESVLKTIHKTRAAIRRPLDSFAQVNVWIVDHLGTPLAFVRTPDAPIFGIDVALQKARTATFFSSSDAGDSMSTAGFGTFVEAARALLGEEALTGQHAFSDRAGGNLSRPFFPDGILSKTNGPFSYPFPGSEEAVNTWSVFNTGFQLALVQDNLLQALGVTAGDLPDSCAPGALANRLRGGIQIFPGSVPLYRGDTLIGGIGVSGDGVDQDDLIAFYSVSRRGLDEVGLNNLGHSTWGFNAPIEKRADRIEISGRNLRLRFVNCPEAPFIGSNRQSVCKD